MEIRGKWNPWENLDMLTPHLVISRSCKKLGHLLTWQQPGKENKSGVINTRILYKNQSEEN